MVRGKRQDTILFRQKFVNRFGVILCTGYQNSRRKIGVVWRVREMLRLEAESGSPRVDLTSLSMNRAIKEVAAIKLNPRLSRPNFQSTAILRFITACSNCQFFLLTTLNLPIVLLT